MAIVTDPDSLVDGTDIIINVSTKTIQIVDGHAITAAGATGGVTGQCLYSKLKELWKSNSTYIKYPFPMESITPEQFEFVSGWQLYGISSRKLIRNAGWAEKDTSGTITQQWAGIISLGSIANTDIPYFRWDTGDSLPLIYVGPINEAIPIFGIAGSDAAGGGSAIDHRTSLLQLYVRTQGKTYGSSTSTAIGASSLTYQVYRFPLSNATDLNITADDTTISTTAPYTQISVQYFTTDQNRYIDSTTTARPFRIVISDASGIATAQQIYEKIQYLLRQGDDIDSGSGTVIGNTADALLSFSGSTLNGATGVVIDNLNSNYLNSVEFIDQTGVSRTYPFVAAGTITFGANAGSGDFKYWMFPASTFGTSSAAVVTDKSGTPISGTYTGSPVSFTFNYDTDTQGGHTAGTDFPVKVLGIGLSGGQYVEVDYTLTRSAGQSILLAPAQERNYSNP